MPLPYLPDTTVDLISLPRELSTSIQRDFASEEAQSAWFANYVHTHIIDLAYQREDDLIIVPGNAETYYDVNYARYNNVNYRDKWIYAFVDKVEYIDDDTTALHFTIDVFQTFMFQYTLGASYIVRSHMTQSTSYINTVPEGLHYGDVYRCVHQAHVQQAQGVRWAIITSTVSYTTAEPADRAVSGIPDGLYYYLFALNEQGKSIQLNNNAPPDLDEFLYAIQHSSTFTNTVVSVNVLSMIPFAVSGTSAGVTVNGAGSNLTLQSELGEGQIFLLNSMTTNQYFNITTVSNKYAHFPDYEETKLLRYPYSFIKITNQKGGEMIVRPEYINGNSFTLRVIGCVGMNPKTASFVVDYLDASEFNNLQLALIDDNVSDVPVLNDYMASFIQSNKNALQNKEKWAGINRDVTAYTGLISGAANMGTGLLTANPMQIVQGIEQGFNSSVSAVKNYQQTIETMNAQLKDIDNIPPNIRQMGGNNYFELNNDITGLYIQWWTITAENADRLSDYFHMYGVKCNDLSVPNTTSRRDFNYIQLLQPYIYGEIPKQFMDQLITQYEAGITIFHNDNIGDYSQSNPEN